jgi:hypothetical protein
MKRSVAVVGAMMLLAVSVGRARPQDDNQARAFVASVVEALNSKSLERRQALLHPKSLPCATIEPDSFYTWMVTRQFKDLVPADYKWKITPMPPEQPLLFADKFDYPVRPTHTLQLNFELAPHGSKAMLLYLVRDADRWYEMTPCPRTETLAAARTARQAEARRAERVQALVAAMPADLRSRVLELVKAGGRIDAAKHYQAAAGEDLTTAVAVVDLLAPK